MLKFGHSRHRALEDFKRTWRDDKTTCGVFWRSVKNHRTFRSVSMSEISSYHELRTPGLIKKTSYSPPHKRRGIRPLFHNYRQRKI